MLRNRGALFGYIYSCVPRHADAEDILQEVALVATSNFEKLVDESGFLPWTLEIARRCILAHLRRGNRDPVISTEIVNSLAEAAASVGSQEQSVRTEALLDCLASLPEKSKELVTLRYDGSTRDVSELAAITGRTVSATYALLKRIRASLRDCVERKLSAGGIQ